MNRYDIRHFREKLNRIANECYANIDFIDEYLRQGNPAIIKLPIPDKTLERELGYFIELNYNRGNGERYPVSLFYNRFIEGLKSHPSQKLVSMTMERLGISRTRNDGKRCYIDLSLKSLVDLASPHLDAMKEASGLFQRFCKENLNAVVPIAKICPDKCLCYPKMTTKGYE